MKRIKRGCTIGYEIVYKYHDRNEDGEYNKEETKEFKKKLGDIYDDLPLEKLATAIMGQLARRDVWIVDFEVFEYKKQKINAKETKGGLIIKHKKFTLDEQASLQVQEVSEPPVNHVTYTQQIQPHNLIQTKANLAERQPAQSPQIQPHNFINNRRPIKMVEVDPNLVLVQKLKSQKHHFSLGKKYKVYAERESGGLLGSTNYIMEDDNGREVEVSSDYFISDVNLGYDKELQFSKKDGGPRLMFDDQYGAEMPDIRRR